jgi:lysine 2,3-aminomutase
MYCRFCFRKTLLNDQRDDLFQGELSEALEYIKTQGSVSEVILSGGDPFLANEELLSSVLDTLDSLSHIKRVRFHTRVPVTLPIRVTESFAELLKRKGFQTIIVSHFNHPKEITPSSLKAIGVLKNADFLLLNQSVLLKGVNDCSETLEQLQLSLFEAGVLPYYLHHPDRAEGTSHFDLSFEEGKKLFNELQTRLPGYLCPRYVIDKIDEPFKSIIE